MSTQTNISRIGFILFCIALLMPAGQGMRGGPSQKEIDDAIDSGVKFLTQQLSDGKITDKSAKAFVAYALSHCGVKTDDPALKPVVVEILADQLKGTYHAAICILTLSYFDPDNDKYRERIAECDKVGSHDWYGEGADYLLKAQGKDGGWNSPDHLAPHTTTAYAMLFLKRASIGIIETGTPRK